jgi:hypothetical protein
MKRAPNHRRPETVLSASRSVESAVAKLRGEVETFLSKVAI